MKPITRLKMKVWFKDNIATIELLVVFAVGIYIGTLFE